MDVVNVIEVCNVSPQQSSRIETHSFPLAFLDITWLRFCPFQRLFFYEVEPCHVNIPTFLTAIVPRLKQSLSVTLQHYLPLAGNILWDPVIDAPSIHYVEGDTVTFIVSEAMIPDDFYRLSGDNCVEVKEFVSFVPPLPSCEARVAAISFQVTLFPGAGFSIGFTAHHAVMDGKGMCMFMQAWAWSCRMGEQKDMPTELIPYLDRTVMNDIANSNKNFVEWITSSFGGKNMGVLPPAIEPRPDVFHATYKLTRKDIEKIKNSLHDQMNCTSISSFTAACAHIWSCIVKAEDKDEYDNIVLGIVVDIRNKLDPPLPSNYFGNVITLSGAAESQERLRTEKGLVFAAEAVTKAIKDLSKGCLKVHEEWLRKLSSRNDLKKYGISGSPRFEHYSVDFGWGRPKKTMVASTYKTGDFSLEESRDGDGGIEVSLVLKKLEMESFASLFMGGLR